MRVRAAKLNNPGRATRVASGQALVEGTAIIVVMIISVVLLTFLLLNTTILGTYNYRLNAIAAESARQLNAGRWWLGMRRPTFDKTLAEGDVKVLVEEEVAAMGYKKVTVKNFKFDYSTPNYNKQVSILRVSFDVTGLKTFSAGIFPSTVTIHASGMSSDAEYVVAEHGMALIDVVDPTTGIARGVRVPIYNATRGSSIPADNSGSNPWLNAGDSIGQSPTVTLNIYCPNSGQLSMQAGTRAGVIAKKIWPDSP